MDEKYLLIHSDQKLVFNAKTQIEEKIHELLLEFCIL